MERKRITAVQRRLNGIPIYIFPYCLVGKKGMVKAFYQGSFINVHYKDTLKNCDKTWNVDQWYEDKMMMDGLLKDLGINVRRINKASIKLGITEQLFVGRVYNY